MPPIKHVRRRVTRYHGRTASLETEDLHICQTRFHITLDVLYLTEVTNSSDSAVVPPTRN